jgi:iron(III) transport system ATP-binding protein
VEELLELVGLPDQGDKYPAQLSGGQQQRIALARAIAVSPGLLLLDEPLSALDAKVRVRLRGEVKDLQRRLGITTVMVTHDQEEGLTMADRIVVMDHGRIEQIGTPLEIYREPRTSFVADFIGTMNFVAGTVCGPASVRFGRQELFCETDGLAVGTPVTIAVRPEDIVVQGVTTDQENVYQARVQGLEFLGSFVRANLFSELTGEEHLRADLSINLIRRESIADGDSLLVRIPRERIRVYPGSVSRE